MEEFVLPERWCVIGCRELEDWQKEDMKDKCSVNFTINSYYYTNDSHLFNWKYQTELPLNYEVISFDSFIKYVYGKNLIGYELKSNCIDYAKAACQIEGYIGFGESIATGTVVKDSESIAKLKKAGVLNLWFKPVFGNVYPKINGYDGKQGINSIIHYGCAIFDVNILKILVEIENLSSNRSIKSIVLNSDVNIDMKDIKKIIETYDSETK